MEIDSGAACPTQTEDFCVLVVANKVFPEFYRLLVFLPEASDADDDMARLHVWRADPHQLQDVAFLQSLKQLHLLQLRLLEQKRPQPQQIK